MAEARSWRMTQNLLCALLGQDCSILFCGEEARNEDVYSEARGTVFPREVLAERVERCLRGGIDEDFGEWGNSGHGSDVDDGAPGLA